MRNQQKDEARSLQALEFESQQIVRTSIPFATHHDNLDTADLQDDTPVAQTQYKEPGQFTTGEQIHSNVAQRGTINLAYRAERYHSGFPSCLYLPSNDVLFKLMRACIGVERIQDLWIYCDEDEDREEFER